MNWITLARTLHRYWKMTQDPRTPKAVKYLIYGGIAYTLIPEDLIPDWVPGLGLIDDAAVLPSVVAISMLLIPQEVKDDHDQQASKDLEAKRKEGKQARIEDAVAGQA